MPNPLETRPLPIDPEAAKNMAKPPAWFRRQRVEVIPNWHGVFPQVDDMASDMATVDFACMLCAFLKPAVIVEAGTYCGHMAGAIANTLFQINHFCMIYTADVSDFGFREFMADKPWRTFVKFHQIDYLEMLTTITDPIDVAFIDASHNNDPAMRVTHTAETFKYLRPGGLMLIDDTAANDWDGAKQLRYDANIYFPGHRGLSIYQKPMSR